MKSVIPLVLSLFLFSGIAVAGVDKPFVDDTRAYLSKLEKLGFAGVLLFAEDGKPLIAEGYGLANRETSARWTPNSIGTTGSITKQFTAAAIMVLQEQGLVNVQDALPAYFSNVPDDKAKITLHQLLTHSSGIVDPQGIDDFDENTRDEYVRKVLEAPLDSEPGSHYEYANANFSLLGAIIEMKTGKNYESALRELVFEPAGLKETGYTMPKWDESRIVQGYEGNERWGTILERPMAEDGPFWALRANGGIYSTAMDMLRWANALLDNKVMSAESRDAMWTPHVDESNGDGDSFYGYGWVVLDKDNGARVITHNGGNGILFADFAIIPEKKIVAFMQCNVVADFQTANGLFEDISMRLFAGQQYPAVPNVVDSFPKGLENVAGIYTIEGGESIDIAMDGNAVRVHPHGWRAFAIVHSLPGEDVDMLADLSGKIDGIVGAYIGGDFQPLYEAYDGKAPIERLKEGFENRQRQREEEYGPFQGYDVLGTGTGDEYHFTLVRFRYEHDSILRTYVWERGGKQELLGMTPRRMDPTCRFYPVAGGKFQSWEPAFGTSVSARFDFVPDAAVFVVERDAGSVMAKR